MQVDRVANELGDMVLDMEVDNVADEVTNMVMDIKVDKVAEDMANMVADMEVLFRSFVLAQLELQYMLFSGLHQYGENMLAKFWSNEYNEYISHSRTVFQGTPNPSLTNLESQAARRQER